MAKKTSTTLKITLTFIFPLLFYIWQGATFSTIHIHFFASYLALCFCLKEHFSASWLAILAGILIDLLSTTKMGLWSLNFFMLALFFHPLRNHFYTEKPIHLAIYSTIISAASSIFHYIFLFIFDRCAPFLGKWIFLDFLVMPVVDGLYAMVWFFSLSIVESKWKWKKQ